MKSHFYMPWYFHLQIKYLIGFLLRLRQGFVSVFKRMTIRSAKIEHISVSGDREAEIGRRVTQCDKDDR